jgi:hypothetical protein
MYLRIIITAIAVAHVASAQLQWSAVSQSVTAIAGQPQIEVKYDYVNTTRDVIHVQAVTPDCSCTIAADYRKRCEPGETGTITALFAPGQHAGKVTRHLRVDTSKGKIDLGFEVSVRDWVRVNNRLIIWETGEKRNEKKICVVPSDDRTVDNVSVSPNTSIRSSVTADGKGGFHIALVPIAKEGQVRAELKLRCERSAPYAAVTRSVFVIVN